MSGKEIHKSAPPSMRDSVSFPSDTQRAQVCVNDERLRLNLDFRFETKLSFSSLMMGKFGL
jgi:hypothetical protein